MGAEAAGDAVRRVRQSRHGGPALRSNILLLLPVISGVFASYFKKSLALAKSDVRVNFILLNFLYAYYMSKTFAARSSDGRSTTGRITNIALGRLIAVWLTRSAGPTARNADLENV